MALVVDALFALGMRDRWMARAGQEGTGKCKGEGREMIVICNSRRPWRYKLQSEDLDFTGKEVSTGRRGGDRHTGSTFIQYIPS